MNIWKSVSIDAEKIFHSQIGPLDLWLKRFEDELQIAANRQDEERRRDDVVAFAAMDEAEPEDLEWGRWVIGDRNMVQMLPVMPDRPLVVRPELPVNIPKGHQALFFVSIPVWVRVCAGKTDQLDLCEEPTVILSNIWYGDTMSGQLCYSLKTRARRKIKDTQIQPWRAICPVKIKNSATTQLEVERFCIDADHLSIYDGDKQPWANTVEISFRGAGHAIEINYSSKAPDFQGVGQLLSKARRPAKKTLLRKSLVSFKSLSGMKNEE